MRELILGGQRSGKSRCAEVRAKRWLTLPAHSASLIATATADDPEMRLRIEKHRVDRARSLPGLETIESPLALPETVAQFIDPGRLLVIDCLTLWLTNLLMPARGQPVSDEQLVTSSNALADAVRDSRASIVLVSNEIGLGITPLGEDARRFVDALGRLHQLVASLCDDVTLMVAGIEVAVKRSGRKWPG